MRVLVLFEFSGRVSGAFRARGHTAYSMDLLPTLGDPRYHWQQDITIAGTVLDDARRQEWDLVIAHPSCTRVTNAGVRWLYKGGRGTEVDPEKWGEMEAGAGLMRWLDRLAWRRFAMENPVPHDHALQIIGRKYDQIIQPWQFGTGEIKKTCLWLQNLPKLQPTKIVPGRTPRVHHESPGIKGGLTRAQRRSITDPGIADAFAEQWGNL
jgi:hypothetical protein